MTEHNDPLQKGRVTEVCKEWVVREDGALAYRLQSEEINEHYKGNRHRNQVVRTDFPTALSEQIKEKLNAERITAQYQQQAELDAIIAKELADKIKLEMELDKLRKVQQSEIFIKKYQDQNLYENVPLESPKPVHNELPVPPRKSNLPNTTASMLQHTPPRKQHIKSNAKIPSLDQYVLPTAQNAELNYVSLDLGPEQITPIRSFDHTTYTKIEIGNNALKDIVPSTSEIKKNNMLSNKTEFHNNNHSKNSSFSDEACSQEYSEIAFNDLNYNSTVQKLSPEKYDYLMGNINGRGVIPKKMSPGPSHANQTVANTERIKTLLDLGLPPEEICELDRRLEQEIRDEELARQLQNQESTAMNQEEKDRLLAIEAQDKELARMLQDREKLKAKRAKEKARLKKIQQKNDNLPGNIDERGLIGPESEIHSSNFLRDKISSFVPPYDNISPHVNHNPSEPYSNEEKYLDENYSIPVDLIKINESNANKSSNTANYREEGIYTFPVASNDHEDHQRPNKLDININRAPSSSFSTTEMQNSISSDLRYYNSCSPILETPANLNLTQNEYTDDLSPVPPYMPIQGQRRNTSSDLKKKRAKDKCTHQ